MIKIFIQEMKLKNCDASDGDHADEEWMTTDAKGCSI